MAWLLTSFPSVLCGSASGLIGAYGAWHSHQIERHRSPVFLCKEGHRVKAALLRHRASSGWPPHDSRTVSKAGRTILVSGSGSSLI